MPKLFEILTKDEHESVINLKIKMLDSISIRESDYYRSEIEKIFKQAKERYYTS